MDKNTSKKDNPPSVLTNYFHSSVRYLEKLKLQGKGSYRLTVSHVAYQPVFMDIEPGKESAVLNVAMHIHEMEEVKVTAKVSVRESDIELFWRTILGKKPSKKTIQATNPEAVYYYYNSETNKLTVTCRVPLQIVNYETGYRSVTSGTFT